MSWARPTVARISHRRGSGGVIAEVLGSAIAVDVVAIPAMVPTGRRAVVGHRK
jgi:hypothetical protein